MRRGFFSVGFPSDQHANIDYMVSCLHGHDVSTTETSFLYGLSICTENLSNGLSTCTENSWNHRALNDIKPTRNITQINHYVVTCKLNNIICFVRTIAAFGIHDNNEGSPNLYQYR